jgi:hypothetical protein
MFSPLQIPATAKTAAINWRRRHWMKLDRGNDQNRQQDADAYRCSVYS